MDYGFIFMLCFLVIILCENFHGLTWGTWCTSIILFTNFNFQGFLLIPGDILVQSPSHPVYFHPRKRHQLHKRQVFEKKPVLLVVESFRSPPTNAMFVVCSFVWLLAFFACFWTPSNLFASLIYFSLKVNVFFPSFGIIYLVLNETWMEWRPC